MSTEALREALRAEAARFDVGLEGDALRLALTHASELLRWNAKTNLTRITEPRELARRHFVESFLAARLASREPEGVRWLDVGSGGGFPGLAARILAPDTELTMVEPRAKKCAFLRAVARHHPDPRPAVVCSRLELLHVEQPWDILSFRALKLTAEAIQRVLSPSGLVIGYPGGDETWSEDLARNGFHEQERLDLGEDGRAIVSWRRAKVSAD